MNLQLLCKINGVIVGINGLSAIFMYNMWFNMAGIEATGPTIALCQSLGVAVAGTALISWITASNAGEAINTYGRCFAYIHSGFVLLSLYQIMQDYVPNPQPFYINVVISLILAAAFFYYSRKTE
ncbi:MAG: hypothetical protein CFH22_01505 [Alphaproteobacteria bacterium MarineAlpha5_Bin12]|nr:hypothetical protein [Pelagibacteraceae bacterium]PPR40492.1 MAG: hypothetical protein CFH22_01505 [Alphaproteobacteria bacterium MarineAlpha5_Bin12]|tara:strand:- start:7602 stop:7976 length:375 start_codon:yes stop_codon:yes gene_type:complete